MDINKRLMKYARENFTGVMHTTLNPNGPGVVRIHLIPPKIENGELVGGENSEVLSSSVAILNGQDIVPVNVSWAILLCEFIKQVNKFAGRSISDEDMKVIKKGTLKGVRKAFPFLPKDTVEDDIYKIMTSFADIAQGRVPEEEIGYLNIGEYAPFMKAPHRMDLLVSSMTKEGKWNCNLKCVHCYAAGQSCASEEELSTDDWKKIIDKCKDACIPQLTFTGGEPTMRSDLVELIDYSRWFVTCLNTNGVKLTKEYCEELYAASLDSMQITFYSWNREVHNELVGEDHYDETVAGIKNAIAAGINISINTPLCTSNRDYVKTLEFLHELGVRYVTCSGLIITGNATKERSESLQLTKAEIKEVLREAVMYAYDNDMEISFTSPGWIEKNVCETLNITTPTCGACLSNMAITPSGNVVPCQSWLSDEPLGNMLTDEWDTIWNSEGAKKRRDYSAEMLGLCPFREASLVEEQIAVGEGTEPAVAETTEEGGEF